MSEKKASNRGSHGKYGAWIAPEGLLKIQGWARDGLSDKQIAHNIGITQTTLYEWQKRFPELSEALKKGKEVVDREVENALLKRAMGYDRDFARVTKAVDLLFCQRKGETKCSYK